jgi:hypothetical protein
MNSDDLEKTSNRIVDAVSHLSGVPGRVSETATRFAGGAPAMVGHVSRTARDYAGRVPRVADQVPDVANRMSGEVGGYVRENFGPRMVIGGLIGLLAIFFLVAAIRSLLRASSAEHAPSRRRRRRATAALD